MSFTIKMFDATSADAAHPTVSVDIPEGYKLLGGGALDQAVEPGNLLTASYPESRTRWTVAGKDHIHSSPSRITAYALALFDPKNEWETIITVAPGAHAQHPSATAFLPASYVMTGGGALVDWSGAGNLLTASYPSGASSWQVHSKDHEVADPATIIAYAIGLRRRDRQNVLRRTVAVASGPSAPHPTASISLPAGWHLTGGGAFDNWFGAGNLLTASYPQGNAWLAAGKDHDLPSPSSLTVYAIGIRLAL